MHLIYVCVHRYTFASAYLYALIIIIYYYCMHTCTLPVLLVELTDLLLLERLDSFLET